MFHFDSNASSSIHYASICSGIFSFDRTISNSYAFIRLGSELLKIMQKQDSKHKSIVSILKKSFGKHFNIFNVLTDAADNFIKRLSLHSAGTGYKMTKSL